MTFDVFVAGLVSLEEMRAKQDSVIKARETQIATDEKAAHLDCEADGQRKRKKKKKSQVATVTIASINHDLFRRTNIYRIFVDECFQTSALSFNFDEEDGEDPAEKEDDDDNAMAKKKRLGSCIVL